MNRRVFALLSAALLVIIPTGYSLRAAAPVYTVEDLGNIAGLVPNVTGLNAAGQISGYVNGPNGSRAVWFSNNTWNYLPGLSNTLSLATGINAHGDITGYRMVTVVLNGRNTNVLRAFRYVHDSAGVEAIDPPPGATAANAFGIDDNGRVVGSANIIGVGTRAWMADGTTAALLPNLDATTSKACGVNGSGQIVGSYISNPAGPEHAFRLDLDGQLNDLSTLQGGAGTSLACAIDSDGTAGGKSAVADTTHAFVSAGGTPVDVTPAGTTVAEVKSLANGVAVGTFVWSSATGETHAFVHTDVDGSSDLNDRIGSDSGWVLSSAAAVGANGQIIGQGIVNGNARAFRLTPPPAASDTTAPTITDLSANPPTISLPNNAMVPVAISVAASDDDGLAPSCAITAIDGHGAPASDFSQSGSLAATVRATAGATYTFTVTCTDAAGNQATRPTDVVVLRDTTAPVITRLAVNPSTIAVPNNALVAVTVSVAATDDVDPNPTCAVTGIDGHGAPASDFSVSGTLAATVRATGGALYTFTVTCTDAAGNPATGTTDVVVLRDSTPPVITGITASPATLSPPNNQLVTVTVAVTASDNVDAAPACALSSIVASGVTTDDYSITGPFTARLRAVGGRTYRLNVLCTDAAGNRASGFADVVVPADTTAPVVTSLTATPGYLWAPNGKMVRVTLSVQATDNVDAAPQCTLTSITSNGGAASDVSVTGPLAADVRAEKNGDGSVRVYTFLVTCVDAAGNASTWATGVAVSKDPAWSAAVPRFKLVHNRR